MTWSLILTGQGNSEMLCSPSGWKVIAGTSGRVFTYGDIRAVTASVACRLPSELGVFTAFGCNRERSQRPSSWPVLALLNALVVGRALSSVESTRAIAVLDECQSVELLPRGGTAIALYADAVQRAARAARTPVPTDELASQLSSYSREIAIRPFEA